MTDAAALFTAKTPPGLFAAKEPSPYATLGSSGDSGAISGGPLRPGSIDQATFLRMLQQEQQNRQAAGVGGKPVAMPSQNFQTTNVPTLSSAQFARLVGGANADPGLAANPVEAPAGDPQAMAAAQTQLQSQVQAQLLAQARAAAPAGPSLKLSGTAASRNAQSGSSGQAGPVDGDRPTISRAAAPEVGADEMPNITRKSAPVLEAATTTNTDKKPAESATETETESKTESDPDVVHLKSPPDKDEQKELRMRNKRWVVDETPGARQLFFGDDGEFGWDDFLDMINPLQHIPGIAQLYRAVTGDKINGAANLLGAIPFGPLGGVGLIASVADLAVKDATGDDIGGNLVAAIFGRDDKPGPGTPIPADMADASEDAPAAVPAGTVQTASRYTLSDASQMHADCRG